MNICAINYNDTKTPAFGYSGKNIYNEFGRLLYRTTTMSFRDDLDWIGFSKEISKYFKDVDKVRVFNYGCSTGEEVYTFIMSLLVTLGKEARKFFKVIAKDINADNINSAKTGTINADIDEYKVIKDYTKSFTDRFLTFNDYEDSIHFKPIITDNAEFSQANILEDIDNLPEKNKILFCRNFLSYLSDEELVILFDKISGKFTDTSSVLVLGNYDTMTTRIRKLLFEHGFVQFGRIDNAYIKKYDSRIY